MYKKLLSALSLGLLMSTAASAQFSMNPVNDTIELSTTGQGNYNPSEESFSNTIDPTFYINNTSGNSMTFKWTLISDSTEHPAGWVLTGICDNIVCRAPWDPWYYGQEQTTLAIAAGETSPVKTLIEARIYAPVGSNDGTGVFRIKLVGYNTSDLNTPLKTDTLVIILHKNTTSIAAIQADDKRVALYPNPAASSLQVYTERNLDAASISILNINGAVAYSTAIEKGNETTLVNINSLATGTYMVRVNDSKGNMITTRKLIKK